MNALALLALLCLPSAAGWRLVHEEGFDAPLETARSAWRRDPHGPKSPWEAGEFDDDGAFFQKSQSFATQLASFDVPRQRVPFGKGGWLTAELAARDRDKDGKPEGAPRLSRAELGGRTVGLIEEPSHDGGVLIRSTKPLPARYRVEMELVLLEFGGSRYGRWGENGYRGKEAKTTHPWSWGPGEHVALPYEKWTDARCCNGFYYLAITDYPNPAPHNNVFIHTRRKVVMDSYSVPDGGLETCNPATKEFYAGQDNAVAAFFTLPGSAL